MKNKYTKKHKKDDVKNRGEVFTPEWLVEDMLAKLPQKTLLNPVKTVLDNSCGSGNFLAKVLELRVKGKVDPYDALSTIYGVELDPDNAKECRDRLVGMIAEYGGNKPKARRIVNNNIITGDGLMAGDYWNDKGKRLTDNQLESGGFTKFC